MRSWFTQLRASLRFKGDVSDFHISPDGVQVSLPTGMRQSDRLLEYLRRAGFDTEIIEHAPVQSEKDGQELIRGIPGIHPKTMLVRDDRSYFLLVTDSDVTDLESIGAEIDASGTLAQCSPEILMEHLNVSQWSASPLAAINDLQGNLTVVVDGSLLRATRLVLRPLTNARSIFMSGSGLAKFLASIGHKPLFIS